MTSGNFGSGNTKTEGTTGIMSASAASSTSVGPPPVPAPTAKSRPKASHTREQAQTEIGAILSDTEHRRTQRSEEEQQMHDAMLNMIFKAMHEDSVPDFYLRISSTGCKDRMGCEIPKISSSAGHPQSMSRTT